MSRCSKLFCKVLSLVVMLLLVFGVVNVGAFTADAATTSKTEKSYEIAVVFDNSGSMYDNSAAWCRAKYAMEIFASMLNYNDGDRLMIFPMWEVYTDGSKPSSGGSYSPIEINSKDSINKISKMYTVAPDGTPYAPVTEAYNYLKKSKATDKWLIVLTDGEFNLENRTRIGNGVAIDLQSRLTKLASDKINVQYLGFAGAKVLKENAAKHFFAKTSNEKSLKDDLIKICNSIFQRSELPKDRLSGNTLNLDLSMKNLIVFVQGSNAKITSLKDSSGKEVSISLNSGQRKYSEIIAGIPYNNAPVDRTLAGQVVTFSGCPKGKYTLEYSGADAKDVQIFYEPDVDINLTFTNSDGKTVDAKTDGLIAGKYKVQSSIVDGNTGEDVTNHVLMGNDVDLKTYVKKSDESDFTEFKNGTEIEFDPDSSTELYISGKYLKDYTISTKDDPDYSWLDSMNIKNQKVALEVKATVLESQSWYTTGNHDNWNPIKVSVTLDGNPLTDEQLKNTKLSVNFSNDLPYRCEPIKGESAYNVYIGQDAKGNYTEPKTGNYKMTASAVYTDEYNEQTTAQGDASFEIQRYSKFWKWLFWIAIFLIIFAIWFIYMNQKVLPKRIDKDSADFETISAGRLGDKFVGVDYKRKSKAIKISTIGSVDSSEKCSATFTLKPIDKRFKKSSERRIRISGIKSNCKSVFINNCEYVKNEKGVWVKSTAIDSVSPPPIAHDAKNPSFELVRGTDASSDATLTCKIKNK